MSAAMDVTSGDNLRDRLTKATLLLALVNLLSRVLGFARDAVIAYKFGLTNAQDAYNAAIQVPDLLNYLVAGGTLSSTFVPLFRDYWQRERQSAAWRFFTIVTSFMLLLIVSLILVFWIWAPPIVQAYVGHGEKSAEWLAQVVRITRIILPAQIFFVVGGLINGVIYSVRGDDKWYIAVPTLGGVIYNLGFIIGGLALSSRLGIEAFAWGGLVGAFLGPFLLVGLAAYRAGARYHFQIDLRHPSMRRYLVLTVPLMLAVGYSFVDQLIATYWGARLPEGGISALRQAYRLMQVPVGVFGMAAVTAIIGTLAGLAAQNDIRGFRQQVCEALSRVGVVIFPVTVLMIVLAPAAVRILLQRGQFNAADTERVASVLRWYALGMYAWAANYIVARGLYSLQDTLTPAILGTLTTLIMFPLMGALMVPMGADGLALGTTIGIVLQTLLLFVALRRKLRGLHLPGILRSLRHLGIASVAMGAVCWAAQKALYAIPVQAAALLLPRSGSPAGRVAELAVAGAVALVAFVLPRRRLRIRRGPVSARLIRGTLLPGVLALTAAGAAHLLLRAVPAHLAASLAPASHSVPGAMLESLVVCAVGFPVFVWVGLALGEEEVGYLWDKIGSKAARLLKRR